jgi:anthranilate synthase component 1
MAGTRDQGTGEAMGAHCRAEPVSLPAGFDPLALHRLAPARYPFLLESVASGTAQGRHDILFACPGEELRREDAGDPPFLPRLDAAFAAACVPPGPGPEVPFRGGWFLFLAYELRAETEPAAGCRSPLPGPMAVAVRVPAAVIRDRQTGAAWLVAERGREDCLEVMRRDLADLPPLPGPRPGPLATSLA